MSVESLTLQSHSLSYSLSLSLSMCVSNERTEKVEKGIERERARVRLRDRARERERERERFGDRESERNIEWNLFQGLPAGTLSLRQQQCRFNEKITPSTFSTLNNLVVLDYYTCNPYAHQPHSSAYTLYISSLLPSYSISIT